MPNTTDKPDKQLSGGTFGRDPGFVRPGVPRLYVWNVLVTERIVRRCMEDSGDIARYDGGDISPHEAYRIAANWLRHAMEFNR